MHNLRTASGRQLRSPGLIETPLPFAYDATVMAGVRVLGDDGQTYESVKDWLTGAYEWKKRSEFNPLYISGNIFSEDAGYELYAYAFIDAQGRISWAIRNDGSIYSPTTIEAEAFTGNLTGDVTGNLTGDVTGNLTGNVTGNLTGNVTGNLTGNVTASEVTLTSGGAHIGDTAYNDVYSHVVHDAEGRIAYVINLDGSLRFYKPIQADIDSDEIRVNKLIAPGGTIDLDSADTQLLNILEGGAQSGDPIFQEFYSHVVLDSADRIAYGVRPDGTVQFSKQIDGEAAQAARLTPLGDNEIEEDAAYDFYAHVELDGAGRISRAVRVSGEHYFPKADFGAITVNGEKIEADDPTLVANKTIVTWGDSVSEDISMSEVLAQLEPGRQILRRAVGGTPNECILGRFGALPVTGRIFYEVKDVTVVNATGNTVTLAAGDASDINVGDYIVGPGQHSDTVITAVNLGADQITLCIDAGSLVTTADAYKIQRPKIEGGRQMRIDNLLPDILQGAMYFILPYLYVKGLRGARWPQQQSGPADFNRFTSNTFASIDWSGAIAERTSSGSISASHRVVVDTTVTSGGGAAGTTSIVVADASRIAPGHFIMAKGIPFGCRVWSVDHGTNEVKLAMDTTSAVSGNVRVYERVEFKPETTVDEPTLDWQSAFFTKSIGATQLKHCINIFDFDDGAIGEPSRPHWWPNAHHGPDQYNYEKADFLAQMKAFVDAQSHPNGRFLITSYQVWTDLYEGTGAWQNRRDRALWASEAYPENFYDLAKEIWLKAEDWYANNHPDFYNQGWEKTFIEMGSGTLPDPTLTNYPGTTDPLMDGDLWRDGSNNLFILLQTTGDAAHDGAQQTIFGGSHTLASTAGQGIWVRLAGTADSYSTLAKVSPAPGQELGSGRFATISGVTYKGSAYDIYRKSAPRIGMRDPIHSNSYGSQFLGYLIGQELLRRGW